MKLDTEKFIEFIKEHGFRVFAALVTGTLTYYAGYTVASSVLYGITLVALAEGMSLYWPYRLESAQDAGTWMKINISGAAQWTAAIVGNIIAWGSIIVTDLASAVLLASANGYTILTAFRDVPQWSQDVVVYVLPVLAFAHGLLLTLFYIASHEAAHERALRAIHRDSRQKIAKANADAETAKAQSYVTYYERNVTGKAQKAGEDEADAAITQKYVVKAPQRPQEAPRREFSGQQVKSYAADTEDATAPKGQGQ